MSVKQPEKRHGQRGIIMLSTLVALTLIIGLTVLTQSLAVGNTKTFGRLSAIERGDLFDDSLRSLARPLIADAMLGTSVAHSLRLDGSAYLVTLNGQSARISVQNVDGLVDLSRSTIDTIELLLPDDLAETVVRMQANAASGMSLLQKYAMAGGDFGKYHDIEFWVTDISTSSRINIGDLSVHYPGNLESPSVPSIVRQPQAVVFSVN